LERQTYSAAAANLTRGQLLDLLLDVEDRLKTLIRALFAKERRDWEDLIPKQVRDALSNKRSDAAQTRGPSSDLLDRATFGQLIDIVLARWKLFEPIIADKAWVQTTLHELRKARNQLAHGTRPGADDKVKIYLAVAEVSAKIPVAAAETVPRSLPPGRHLAGSRILWADDVPQGNSWARRLLRGFGADVVPVLSNDEAIQELMEGRFDVVVSDIDRGGAEPGSQLGVKMHAAGFDIPIIFFVSRTDPSLPLPAGSIIVTNDMVAMLTCLFGLLRPDALPDGQLTRG
jgi:CheY-like chemotaxis protein